MKISINIPAYTLTVLTDDGREVLKSASSWELEGNVVELAGEIAKVGEAVMGLAACGASTAKTAEPEPEPELARPELNQQIADAEAILRHEGVPYEMIEAVSRWIEDLKKRRDQ